MAHYFNTVHAVAEHPQSGEYFFTDSWESFRFANRKRYQGDYNPDIKSWNPRTGEFKVHTTWRGKDYQPAFDRAGTLYFVSDESNGEFNLYRLAGGKKEALTRFETSLLHAPGERRRPPGGLREGLPALDLRSGPEGARRLAVEVFRNNPLPLEQEFKVAGKITAFNVSPDGKKLAFVSRGRLFVSDIKGRFVREMPTRPEGRTMEVAWLADNKTPLQPDRRRLAELVPDRRQRQVRGRGTHLRPAVEPGPVAEREPEPGRVPERPQRGPDHGAEGLPEPHHPPGRAVGLRQQHAALLPRRPVRRLHGLPQFRTGHPHSPRSRRENDQPDRHRRDRGRPCWSPDGKDLYFTANRREPLYPRGGADMRIHGGCRWRSSTRPSAPKSSTSSSRKRKKIQARKTRRTPQPRRRRTARRRRRPTPPTG